MERDELVHFAIAELRRCDMVTTSPSHTWA
jgi:hypothetical protein